MSYLNIRICLVYISFLLILMIILESSIHLSEPLWFKWHLLQRPGYQTTNKSDVTATDEVRMANCWWDELSIIAICKWYPIDILFTRCIVQFILCYIFIPRMTKETIVPILDNYSYTVLPKNKISLALFPCYFTKLCHQNIQIN